MTFDELNSFILNYIEKLDVEMLMIGNTQPQKKDASLNLDKWNAEKRVEVKRQLAFTLAFVEWKFISSPFELVEWKINWQKRKPTG